MKKISIFLFFMLAAILNISAQQPVNNLCTLGITFEISNNPSWGYGEPVVLSVEPFSPAYDAGIKVDDIIMEVNGVATYLRNYPTIDSWLTESGGSNIRLTVRNTDTYFKEYLIDRQCSPSNALSEFDLASAYSFYSIESTNDRTFSIPMRVETNKDVIYSDYSTFGFAPEQGQPTALDIFITKQVQKALESRGLVRNDNDPDMLVQTYYTYKPNLKYNFSSGERSIRTWRFDSEKNKMVQLPLISAEDPNAESKGQYVLELGVRFFDRKFIDANNLTQIWDCSSREFLSENFSLEEYSRVNLPLMLMQYPYSNSKTIGKYIVSFKKFNYTGLNYDPNQTGFVLSVDKGSPAHLAGMRAGDVISKINNKKFNYTPAELENGYKRFILSTMDLRDPSTKFINAAGFPDCMYWKKSDFQQIKDAFSKSFYATSFSYLYAFEKYISNSNILDIEFRRDAKAKHRVQINPQIQTSVVVKAL